MEGWIDITEYATKYGVSASTLRRRIRGNSIQYRMEKGKYLLNDSASALSGAPLFSRIHPGQIRQTVMPANQVPIHRAQFTNVHDPVADLMANSQISNSGVSLQEYNRVIAENRKLQTQIEELETLIKALDAESDKSSL